MVTRAAKDLLRNTIRSTDYHNRLLEEDEMWRQWDLERGLTMMVTDDYLKKRMRMDQYPEPRKDPRSRLSLTYNKQDARRELNRRGNYWTQKLMDAEAKDPDRWGHSGFKELYPEEFRGRDRVQRARSRSYSRRSTSKSSPSSTSRRSSRSRGKHKRVKNKETKKKPNSRSDRRSDNETKELRHEIRARHQQRRIHGRTTRSNSRDRGRDSPSPQRVQLNTARSRGYNDALRNRNSRIGNSSLSPRRRSRSRSRESIVGRRRLNGPSTPSGSRASSVVNSNRSYSGSSRARSPRARSRSYSPQPSSSAARHKVSSLRSRNRNSRSRSPAARSPVSSSRSSRSRGSSSRSRSRSASSNSSSSFSSDSESSRDERIAQQQQEQLARFRRHFRSHSLDKDAMWHSPPRPMVEDIRLNSEEYDRRPVSLYPTIANPWRSAGYYDPNMSFSDRQDISLNGVRSQEHWDRLQLAYRNNRRNYRTRNRRSLAARERRKRRRQMRKKRRRRNPNNRRGMGMGIGMGMGMDSPGLVSRANGRRPRIGP